MLEMPGADYIPEISLLERQRQVDPWALLARHLVDLVTFGPVRDLPQNTKGMALVEQHPRLFSDFHT